MALLCEKCMVVRTDDHGSTVLVADCLTEAQADELIAGFHGHKQLYLKLYYTSKTRSKVIADHRVIG
jgi:hypothetical protein